MSPIFLYLLDLASVLVLAGVLILWLYTCFRKFGFYWNQNIHGPLPVPILGCWSHYQSKGKIFEWRNEGFHTYGRNWIFFKGITLHLQTHDPLVGAYVLRNNPIFLTDKMRNSVSDTVSPDLFNFDHLAFDSVHLEWNPLVAPKVFELRAIIANAAKRKQPVDLQPLLTKFYCDCMGQIVWGTDFKSMLFDPAVYSYLVTVTRELNVYLDTASKPKKPIGFAADLTFLSSQFSTFSCNPVIERYLNPDCLDEKWFNSRLTAWWIMETNCAVINTIWSLFMIGHNQHHHVLTQLRQELANIPHNDKLHPILPKLTCLENALRESYRLFPPIPTQIRVMKEAVQLPNKIDLKAGDVVHVDVLQMQRSPEQWGLFANDFMPKRWERDTPYKLSESFIHPGKGILHQIQKYLLATLIEAFEPEVQSYVGPADGYFAFPQGGMRMRFHDLHPEKNHRKDKDSQDPFEDLDL